MPVRVPLFLFALVIGALASAGAVRTAARPARADAPVPGEAVELVRTYQVDDTWDVTVFALFAAPQAEAELLMDAYIGPAEARPGPAIAQLTEGAIGRWAEADLPIPVTYAFETDSATTSMLGAGLWGMSRWAALAGHTFRFALTGAAAKQPEPLGCTSGRKVNDINDISFRPLPTRLLGSTCVFTYRQGDIDGNKRIGEFDLEMSTAVNFSWKDTTPPDAYDVYTVMLHELGHALGLGHTTATTALMYESTAPGVQHRDLSPEDELAIRSLYPVGPKPPAAGPMPKLPPEKATRLRLPLITFDK